jgi:hypothetical protein
VSTATLGETELLVIVAEGAPEEEWHEARDEGVTASEIHDIAAGSRKAWRTILDGKLNGSTFRGNAYTKKGHEAEAAMLEQIRGLDDVATAGLSGALFGNRENPLHRATPDGFGLTTVAVEFGIEVKWHTDTWTRDDIPTEHFDQMQWGMHVTGLTLWAYAWTVDGIDGIQHIWVSRDAKRIEQLVTQANAFIDWRAAGAPEIDDIPDDVDDGIATYARGLALETEGKKLKTEGRELSEAWAAEHAKPGEPLRRSGSRASIFYEPQPDVEVLDEDAWATAEPELHAEWLALQTRVTETAAQAEKLYHRSKPVAPKFRVTPNGAKA